mmetsp:Transcript_27986/g.64598  ORF Transcript_27986/g.64598 Transcript_27986/m.64598 type:complete len:177 (-) Transcript_27986:63-593(-)|eukprot:2177806-Amphidinium_carterae.1
MASRQAARARGGVVLGAAAVVMALFCHSSIAWMTPAPGLRSTVVSVAVAVPRATVAEAAPSSVMPAGLGSAIRVQAPQNDAMLGGGLEVIAQSLTASGREVRDVNVMMFNRKSGRGDRSEGFSLRKKFRKCSTLARLATAKGRKIHKRRINAGRKKNINPGDYINPKMQPTVKLMR